MKLDESKGTCETRYSKTTPRLRQPISHLQRRSVGVGDGLLVPPGHFFFAGSYLAKSLLGKIMHCVKLKTCEGAVSDDEYKKLRREYDQSLKKASELAARFDNAILAVFGQCYGCQLCFGSGSRCSAALRLYAVLCTSVSAPVKYMPGAENDSDSV